MSRINETTNSFSIHPPGAKFRVTGSNTHSGDDATIAVSIKRLLLDKLPLLFGFGGVALLHMFSESLPGVECFRAFVTFQFNRILVSLLVVVQLRPLLKSLVTHGTSKRMLAPGQHYTWLNVP